MSGDVTLQAVKRLSWLPERDASDNGNVIAGQDYYDVEFIGGSISNVTLTGVTINGVEEFRTETIITEPGDYNVTESDYILTVNKTIPEPTTIFLPASPQNSRTIIVKDGQNEAAANNITIDGNGNTIDGVTGFIIDVGYGAAEIVFNGTEWNVLNTYRIGAGGDVSGPNAATDNAITRFDGTSGKVIQSSSASIDDSGNISANNLSGTNTGDQTTTGTLNRISVTDGGANPVIDIDANYAGQSSIDTVGTVTTGVWDATNISISNGGTGASTASDARDNLGLGTAAIQDVGTSIGDVVQLVDVGGNPALPAVDGSNLTNITANVADGDRGDITVSSTGSIWTIDANAVTTAKIADNNVTEAKLPSAIDLGNKTSLEIPNSASPSVSVTGQIAVDTTVTNWSHGILRYYGGESLDVMAMPTSNAASPTDGQVVTYDAAADELKFSTISSNGSASNEIYNLVPSYQGPGLQWNVTSGSCWDSTRTVFMVLSSGLSNKNSGTAWAAGSNQGANDGTISGVPGERIQHFLISNASGLNTDVICSLNESPTLPMGYTNFRRIWTIAISGSNSYNQLRRVFLTTGGGLINYIDDQFLLTDTASTLGTTQVNIVPAQIPIHPTARFEALVEASFQHVSVGTTCAIYGDYTASASSVGTGSSGVASIVTNVASRPVVINTSFIVNSSSQVHLLSSAASTTYTLKLRGWIDARVD